MKIPANGEPELTESDRQCKTCRKFPKCCHICAIRENTANEQRFYEEKLETGVIFYKCWDHEKERRNYNFPTEEERRKL